MNGSCCLLTRKDCICGAFERVVLVRLRVDVARVLRAGVDFARVDAARDVVGFLRAVVFFAVVLVERLPVDFLVVAMKFPLLNLLVCSIARDRLKTQALCYYEAMEDAKKPKPKPKPKPRARTYARNRSFSRKGNEKIYESDGMYLTKLILVILLGSFWLKFHSPLVWGDFYLNGLPLGLIVGLFLVGKYEQFQANRKIWYAILLITAIISYFLPSGIVL